MRWPLDAMIQATMDAPPDDYVPPDATTAGGCCLLVPVMVALGVLIALLRRSRFV